MARVLNEKSSKPLGRVNKCEDFNTLEDPSRRSSVKLGNRVDSERYAFFTKNRVTLAKFQTKTFQ
jgi:hypothetical protein